MRETSSSRNSPFQRRAFLLILALISVGFLYMIRHFMLTLFLAAVFAGMSHPLYAWIDRKIRNRPAAAGITLLLLVLLFLLPVAGIAFGAYKQAADIWNSGTHARLIEAVIHLDSEIRRILPTQLDRFYPSADTLAAGIKNLLSNLAGEAGNWLADVASAVVKILLMLLFMFYFLIDGKRILERIVRWSPLPDDSERALLARFLVVGRGAFAGIFVIGSIQGLLTGLLLWATGVPSPLFLGVLTVPASILPALGAGLIWAPAALFLLAMGHTTKGLVVIAVGILVISTVDNLLRPMVVGKSIKMHDSMVLVSTLGGLVVFGLPGFLIGPIIAALFLSAWGIYEEMFATELKRNERHIETHEP
jgi:predicted PurR-regulated permease PerM